MIEWWGNFVVDARTVKYKRENMHKADMNGINYV